MKSGLTLCMILSFIEFICFLLVDFLGVQIIHDTHSSATASL